MESMYMSCDICKKSFATIVDLDKHRAQQLCKEAKYTCGFCGKKFMVEHSKVRHEKFCRDVEGERTCHLCKRVFRYTYMVKQHLRRKRSCEKGGHMEYVCSKCNAKFSSKSDQHFHKRE